MTKTAYVRCEHCRREFVAPIQVPEPSPGAKIHTSNNKGRCPLCGKSTGVGALFWKEES